MMNNELLELAGFLNNELLWVYVIIVIACFYAITSLFTWSIKKPLMFLGIPSIVVGILLIILRFIANLFFTNENLLTIISSATRPLFINGIICVVIGILMIIIYNVLNYVQKKKQTIAETEV